MKKLTLILLLIPQLLLAGNTRPSYPTTEDGTGNGVPLTKSLSGDAASGKVGSTSFSFRDSSGNLILPQLNSSGYFQDFVTNFPSTYAVTQSTSPWTISGNVNASQSGTWTVQQGSAPWSVSQSGTWTTGRTWTLGIGTDSILTRQYDGTHSLTQLFDLDTSGSTHEYNLGVNLRTSASGGSVPFGTLSNPIRIDPTATTTQPISGTVTANAGTGTFQTNVTNSFVPVTQSGSWTNTVTQSTGTNLHTVVDSGTVTANIGTTNGLALDTTVSGLQVSQGSTTSGQKGSLVQGAVTTSAPTYSNGQTSPFSLNTSGGLRVDGSGVTQPVSGTFWQSVQPVSQSGSWTVLQGSPPWSVSQSGTWTTGRTWTLASGTDSVTTVQGTSPWVNNITQFGGSNVVTGTGASGSGIPRVTVSNDSNILATQSGSWSVTANAGTNLNTSALALSANQTNGSQKTQVVDASGNILPTINGFTSGTITAACGSSNPASCAAGSFVRLAVPWGDSASSIQLTGTFTGTVNFASSEDGGTTYNARVYRSSGILNNLQTNTTTVPSEWRGNVSGMSYVIVYCSSYTSGTLNVSIQTSKGPGAIFLNAAIPIGGLSIGNTTVNQTMAGSASVTGTYEDMTQVASISGAITLTQNGTLHTQFSLDGITTNTDITYPLTANTPFYFTVPPTGQYYRVQVDNGSASSATLNIDTYYRSVAKDVTRLQLGNVSSLNDTILAPIERSILTGRVATNSYMDIRTDSNGNIGVRTNGNASGTPTQTSVSCATSSTTLLAGATATQFISIRNPTSATATVWLNIAGAAATTAAPSIDLPPGGEADYTASENSFLPTSQINCISGGASASTLTLIYK